ncbi:MAG: conserved hypothetical protein [Methanobrevibacter sp. CfCl-M3]
MKTMEDVCEKCGSPNIEEVDGVITCNSCETKYPQRSSKYQNFDEELKEREIRRLTSPVKHKLFSYEDIEGNPVQKMFGKYIIEPKFGILTDDEILKYAGDSKTASRIKLKRGIGQSSDKTNLYNMELMLIWLGIGLFGSIFVGIPVGINFGVFGVLLVLIFVLGIPAAYTLYVLHLKDYRDKTYEVKETTKNPNPTNNSNRDVDNEKDVNEVCDELKDYEKDINDLKAKYQSKEETAKKVISEYFPPPQLTYDRFIGEVDIWGEKFHKQVELALNIINLASEYTSKVDEELKNRINILETIVKKMDELVVELAINLGNSSRDATVGEVNELITGMQNVIDSIKKYDY